MDRTSIDRERSFLDCFVQGGMRVTGAGDVFAACAEFKSQRKLGDHCTCIGAENVSAQHAVCCRIGKDFDEAKHEAFRVAAAEGLHFVPSFHRDLVKGVATYAFELFRDGTDGLAYLLKDRIGEVGRLLEALRVAVQLVNASHL